MDPAPDPALFINDLQDADKNNFFFSKFLCLFLFEEHLHISSKINNHMKVNKQ